MCHRHYDLHAEPLREETADRELDEQDEPDEDEELTPAVADD